MGISEAFYIPAALALIADVHRGSTRSRAVGLHQMGIYLGVIVGGFGGYAADHPEPRLALGLRRLRPRSGSLYAVPLFLLLAQAVPAASRVRRWRSPSRASSTGPGRALRELLGNGSFLLLVPTSRCRRWPAGSCATGCRRSSRRSSASARAWPACRRRSTGRSRRSSAPSVGGWLADRWMRRSPRGRIFASAHRHGADRAGDVRRRLRAGDRPAVGGGRLPDPVRPGLGVLRRQQHAHPVAGRAALAARHRLRHHEPGQHQLRRLRRLGLRPAARPARAAVRHLRHLRERRGRLRRCSSC